MPKDLPSSLQQHGRCRSIRLLHQNVSRSLQDTPTPSPNQFRHLQKELIHTRPWRDLTEVQQHTFWWIEDYYNRRATLNYLTPLEYRQRRYSGGLAVAHIMVERVLNEAMQRSNRSRIGFSITEMNMAPVDSVYTEGYSGGR